MIAYLKGTCLAAEDGRVVVDVQGLGYAVQTGKPGRPDLVGQEIAYYTFTNVREDALELYGFESLREKALFMALKSVTGIGPKSALAIVTADDPDVLAGEIIRANEAYLTTLPGVGKKTAGRIALELKDKLAASEDWTGPSPISTTGASPSGPASSVLEALSALGYQDQEIREVQKEILAKNPEGQEDDLLRKALSYLRRG